MWALAGQARVELEVPSHLQEPSGDQPAAGPPLYLPIP